MPIVLYVSCVQRFCLSLFYSLLCRVLPSLCFLLCFLFFARPKAIPFLRQQVRLTVGRSRSEARKGQQKLSFKTKSYCTRHVTAIYFFAQERRNVLVPSIEFRRSRVTQTRGNLGRRITAYVIVHVLSCKLYFVQRRHPSR